MAQNYYYDSELMEEIVARGDHRAVVGGLWDEMGKLQLSFLKSQGLKPADRLLDVGCGCLRGGTHYVRYLEAGNYYGIDLSPQLLAAGYDVEITQAGLQDKLPRENLRQTEAFDATGFRVRFDMAVAVSVFTHLPLNNLRVALHNLGPVMKPGGRFFASFFIVQPHEDLFQAIRQPGCDVVTFPDKDPFHYYRRDLVHFARGQGWELENVQSWEHPRNQKMVCFRKV
ncbi:class I SAM-dependent methyltransferase [Pseudoruegeria sp. SHC-113]|uniref:class I SAM-dependent methyltransferase n=1 Tax=Pseudoruegeria sp. SHC-113 TaxID=2855439 RepID=UPI0021BAE207|nr:class I SAM-dependent methyltransferase [Pseudoruegeria sp. SHC-113]MCT8161681.1 class I SAM-dependent methyltransferase [Pseudoruegeria sp. SHC-113]